MAYELIDMANIRRDQVSYHLKENSPNSGSNHQCVQSKGHALRLTDICRNAMV